MEKKIPSLFILELFVYQCCAVSLAPASASHHNQPTSTDNIRPWPMIFQWFSANRIKIAPFVVSVTCFRAANRGSCCYPTARAFGLFDAMSVRSRNWNWSDSDQFFRWCVILHLSDSPLSLLLFPAQRSTFFCSSLNQLVSLSLCVVFSAVTWRSMDMTHPDSRIVERYAYCLCLHVKPATIFIGSIRLAESLLHAARYLTAVFYNGPDMKVPQMAAYQAAIPMCLLGASVSAILLYGVTKSRPACLMPFFWLRLCEFMALLPTFISSLYDHPIHGMYDQHPGIPKSFTYERPMMWPPQGQPQPHKSLFFTTMVLMVQGYFLCVVWKCFRYLKVRELILPLHMPRSNGTDLVIPPGIAPPPINMNISPPDYETATKGNGPPPPDYETAMKHQAEKSTEQTTLDEPQQSSEEPSQSHSAPENITNTSTSTTIETQAGPSVPITASHNALDHPRNASFPPPPPPASSEGISKN